MGQISVTRDLGGIEGLCVIESTIHPDARGYFMETFNQKDMYEAGLYFSFVQDNQCMSTKGVLRGLHFQKSFPQAKLVRVISGRVYDVAVDLRIGSPTFGKHYGLILSGDNRKQYLIPRGFAHGYLVLSDTAEFCYKCDDYYHPDDEGGIIWNDPDIGIQWPEIAGDYLGKESSPEFALEDGSPLILSEKDQKQPRLKDVITF